MTNVTKMIMIFRKEGDCPDIPAELFDACLVDYAHAHSLNVDLVRTEVELPLFQDELVKPQSDSGRHDKRFMKFMSACLKEDLVPHRCGSTKLLLT